MGRVADANLPIRRRLPDGYTAKDRIPVAGARENIPTRGRGPEIDEEATPASEQWRALELPRVGQVLEGLRRKRVRHEGHRVDTAVERYELDPLPHPDLQVGRDYMLHVSASGEFDLSDGGDLRVGIRAE